MPGFEEVAVCRAPAVEVWKLVHDPERFAEWWSGTDRMERDDGGEPVRFAALWPDFAYPLRVAVRHEAGRVVISCLRSDILWEWALTPHPDGCEVRVRVQVPAQEAGRIQDQREEAADSLARLVARAEALAGV